MMKLKSGVCSAFLILCVFLGCATAQRPEPDNPVYRYLKHSELQYEGTRQKSNLKRGLVDIVTLPGHELRRMRYADYRGVRNRWDLPTLLYRHFVPDKKGRTLGDNFYHDVKDADVQRLVNSILQAL